MRSHSGGPEGLLSVRELLESSAWFPALDEEARVRVIDDMRETEVAAGSLLCRVGEEPLHWFGTLKGLLKWCVNSKGGHSVTVGGFFSAGSWFGEGVLLRGSARAADVVALRDSRVASLPAETFQWLHRTRPPFDQFLLRQIHERLHWFMSNYKAHRLLGTDSLVARALAGLFHPFLHPGSHGLLQLTQEEIANLAGVSRQRCNIALKRLEHAGFIRIEYGAIDIVDVDGLRQHCDQELLASGAPS
jgi:CRP/FNR family transcriptional regulator, cyclic AMP receptor protein